MQPVFTTSASRARWVLLAAISAFVLQGFWLAGTHPVWHEETATHAGPAVSQLVSVEVDAGGALPLQGSCEGAPWQRAQTRPTASLCVGGLRWPVLVAPYIGGVTYWPLQLLRPLHHGDPVALRRSGLVIGALAILVLFLLVEAVADAMTAAACAVTAATLSGFVVGHSLLVYYEFVPSLFVALAALVVARRRDPRTPPSARRLAVAGLLLGLSIATNVKGLVVAAPLVALALHRGGPLRAAGLKRLALAASFIALPLLPLLVIALADPHRGLEAQVTTRLATMAAHLHPRFFAEEVGNALIYAGDIGYYFALANGGDGGLVPAFLTLSAFAFLHSLVALFRRLTGRAHSPVAAACGALQLAYIVFVTLAYDQRPAANYAPVTYSHAVSLGCALVTVGRFLATRFQKPSSNMVMSVVALGVASALVSTFRRGDLRDTTTIAINVHAERALAAHLRTRRDTPVITTTYNLAGVLDAFGAPTIDGQRYLAERPPMLGVRESLRERFAQLLADPARLPLRFIVPIRAGLIDEPGVPLHRAALADAARTLGWRITDEARFTSRAGVPVIALLRVSAPPGAVFTPRPAQARDARPSEALRAADPVVTAALADAAIGEGWQVVRVEGRADSAARVTLARGDLRVVVEVVRQGARPFAAPARSTSFDVFYARGGRDSPPDTVLVEGANRVAARLRARGH
jgi:hypothetical protein